MKIYLKGYYGYKNFGDEMIIFGLINYLFRNFNISKYVVEVQDVDRMKNRVKMNHYLLDIDYKKLIFVPIKQDKYKRQTHLKTFFGVSKYRKYTKIFGGGELFDASKSFPHNGRNLIILFWYSILQKNYILIGGIGEDKSLGARFLQKILISRAKKVITRDKISYHRARKYVGDSKEKKGSVSNVISYHDFSFDIYTKKLFTQTSNKIIFINAPFSVRMEKFIKKHIKDGKVMQYMFFPCEMEYDEKYYHTLIKKYPNIKYYDWTKHSLRETLQILGNARCGVGKRLHFCLPLKYYKVPYLCTSGYDKHRKLL